MTKIETIDLKGKEYATVPSRIKQFREDCPNGVIQTEPTITDDQIMFKAFVKKDNAKPESAESTGHSYGPNKGVKNFEKQETIAIGRALATLGYLGSGDVASSEEMEEFYSYKSDKIEEAQLKLHTAGTVDELKEVFMGLGTLMAEPDVVKVKDDLKIKLTEADNESS